MLYLPDSGRSRDDKLRAYENLRRLLDKWRTACSERPFVIAGDFNLWCSLLDATRVESPATGGLLLMMQRLGFQPFVQHNPTYRLGTIIDWVLPAPRLSALS